MNFLLRHHRKLSEVVPVPDGLRELMADITREVLRFQPANIEAFIADYLEAMLMTRELCTIADQTIEDALASSLQIVELLKDGVSPEQADSAVKIIREEFAGRLKSDEPLRELEVVNRLMNECHFTIEQARKASAVIEDSWCHFHECNKSQAVNVQPNCARDQAVKNTLAIYQKSKATSSELNKSGKVLKSGFKGYLARKSKASDEKPDGTFSSANWRTPNFHQRESAAVKIQAWFRGLKDRKQYKEILKAATVIQTAFKRYKSRVLEKQQAKEFGARKQSIFAESPSIKEVEAATKIQSYYRAYKIRKEFKIKQKAATVIQAHFKAFLARKQQKMSLHSINAQLE